MESKKKIDDKNVKKIKILIIVVVILLVIWFLIVSPLIKFKKSEKQVLEAATRYYEINNNLLPTGQKIRTVTLQKLYDKDFISEDIRSPYTNKECDSKTSWAKVRKEGNEYKYYVYLKCGMLSSKIDHKGPEITLKGGDTVTLNKGEKYIDAGIKSVIDDTDGNIDINKVTIDTSKVNINKNGTYEVTYKVRDSFSNETIKIRTVKVEQILNKIVEKDTDKTNVYKGSTENNYIKLDGIIFKIVGLNDDGSVKVVSKDSLAAVDYNGVDDWLNDYFYNKLSDSAKEYIKTDSKWCNEKISNPENYTKCNSYSKKKTVGLLSVADINNSKGEDGSYNILNTTKTWTSNILSENKSIAFYQSNGYFKEKTTDNLEIFPAVNIKKDSYIIKGSGTIDNPYVLRDNSTRLKVGDKISDSKTGDYITYSGYKWRVIGKEEDNTIKVIMNDIINNNGEVYYTSYFTNDEYSYNPNKKGNIGYVINNEISLFVKTKIFEKKNISVENYKDSILYNSNAKKKEYSIKLSLPSIYDLYSTSNYDDYWFINYSSSKKKNCYMSYFGGVYCSDIDSSKLKGIKLIGYIKSDKVVGTGEGTIYKPYNIS